MSDEVREAFIADGRIKFDGPDKWIDLGDAEDVAERLLTKERKRICAEVEDALASTFNLAHPADVRVKIREVLKKESK